jgi:Protein of unknown function (DUF4007)
MRLETACTDTFARHETFHPRFGWFRKAFVAAATEPGIFNDDDATVRLGVGKNMVRSLRFWGTASHLLVDEPVEGTRKRNTKPTNIAAALLQPGGLDPYMESTATWWWLHWLLTGPECQLPVWWMIIHDLPIVELDEAVLLQACKQLVEASTWDVPHESSIAKDISAFVRTYGDTTSAHVKFDDQFGCPLRDLNLLTKSPTSGHRLANERPASIPGAIVLTALLDHAAMQPDAANTISLARVATEPGAPGRAFRLTDTDIAELIEPIVNDTAGLSLSAPAGAPQLGWTRPPDSIARQVIANYYQYSGDDLPSIIGHDARSAYADYELLRLSITADARNTLAS